MTQSATPPPAPDQPPPLGPVLRHYGPPLVVIVFIALGIAVYLSLSARVEALEARVGTSPAAPQAEAAPLGTPPALDAGAAPQLAPRQGSSPQPLTREGEAPDWQCTGSISAELVQVTVGRHGQGVLQCHEQRAAQVPGLVGTLTLRLHVDATGHVDGAHLSGLEDAELIRCVGENALTWQFAPPVGGDCAIVDAPFALGR